MTGYQSKKVMAQDKLAQPEQEPVATLWQHGETGRTRITMPDDITDCDARWFKAADLYTTPPQRTWVEPTGNEWFEWWRVSTVADETEAEIDFADFLIIAQAVVAKLKEKNNG